MICAATARKIYVKNTGILKGGSPICGIATGINALAMTDDGSRAFDSPLHREGFRNTIRGYGMTYDNKI
jgi:hypothetical protein